VADSSEQISFQSVIIIDAAITGIAQYHTELQFLNSYPNPFSSTVNFELDLRTSANITVSIIDISGRQVRSLEAQDLLISSSSISTDLSDLKSGVYFCRIISDGRSYTAKIIKE